MIPQIFGSFGEPTEVPALQQNCHKAKDMLWTPV